MNQITAFETVYTVLSREYSVVHYSVLNAKRLHGELAKRNRAFTTNTVAIDDTGKIVKGSRYPLSSQNFAWMVSKVEGSL